MGVGGQREDERWKDGKETGGGHGAGGVMRATKIGQRKEEEADSYFVAWSQVLGLVFIGLAVGIRDPCLLRMVNTDVGKQKLPPARSRRVAYGRPLRRSCQEAALPDTLQGAKGVHLAHERDAHASQGTTRTFALN